MQMSYVNAVTTLKKILYFAIILSFIVVVLGAYTRLSDAGLGCPDWPTCYGQIITTSNNIDGITYWDAKAWKEMIHRYAASLLGLVIIVISVISVFNKNIPKNSKVTSVLLVFLVVFQGILGMLTVTELLHPVIVLGHLLGGMTIVSLLFWLFISCHDNAYNYVCYYSKKGYYFTILTLIVLLVQITLGGWTSANYAALSCGNDFPTCLGYLLPQVADFSQVISVQPLGINYEYGVLESGARVAIQLLHRLGALVTISFVLVLVFLLKNNRNMQKIIKTMLFLLGLQLILGILNVVLSLPIFIAIMHNLVALLLLLTIVNVIYKYKIHFDNSR